VDGAIEIFERAKELDPSLDLDPTTGAKRVAVWFLVDKGKYLARQGKIKEAIADYKKAKKLNPSLDLNQASQGLVQEGEQLARQGQIKEAIIAYEEAQKLAPSLKISANSWNNLCWYGSVWGHASEVMHACEQAVAMDSANGYFRDSRGVARALIGDFAGAIEDFQVFIKGTKDKQAQLRRQQWIEILKAGKNPFTPEELERLRKNE
jgi:tetratricopeptide (TPR) repeat protein